MAVPITPTPGKATPSKATPDEAAPDTRVPGASGLVPVTTPTRCLRCGRALTNPLSVAVGLGPGCTLHIRRAAPALPGYSDRQLEDALELLELGGLTPLRGRRVWLTVGHRGTTYRTAVTGHCTCIAGLHGKSCHHAAAVHLVAA